MICNNLQEIADILTYWEFFETICLIFPVATWVFLLFDVLEIPAMISHWSWWLLLGLSVITGKALSIALFALWLLYRTL